MILLEATGLRYRHPGGTRDALAGASISVASGEVVAAIGPNAAGKSTLARLCCGLLPAQQGAISLRGTPLPELTRRERARRVAFLPQNPPHDLSFTAREVALMGRAPHLGLWSLEGPHDLESARAALQQFDALDLADRPVSQLSGGERQRVFLARAFAQEAALLILDAADRRAGSRPPGPAGQRLCAARPATEAAPCWCSMTSRWRAQPAIASPSSIAVR